MLTFSPASACSPHICASASAPQSGFIQFINKEYIVFDLCMNEIHDNSSQEELAAGWSLLHPDLRSAAALLAVVHLSEVRRHGD